MRRPGRPAAALRPVVRRPGAADARIRSMPDRVPPFVPVAPRSPARTRDSGISCFMGRIAPSAPQGRRVHRLFWRFGSLTRLSGSTVTLPHSTWFSRNPGTSATASTRMVVCAPGNSERTGAELIFGAGHPSGRAMHDPLSQQLPVAQPLSTARTFVPIQFTPNVVAGDTPGPPFLIVTSATMWRPREGIPQIGIGRTRGLVIAG